MIRVGIAGIGFMGWIHWLTYRRLRGARVVAICEQDRKRLAGDWREIKGNFGPPGEKVNLTGVATYLDLEEFLDDPNIDLVDITLPPALHADVAVKALRAGKHVFSEKPLALTEKDCHRIVRAAEQSRRQLFVGHVLPFFPEYAWARKVIVGGRYGKLRGGSFRRVIADPAWLSQYWIADVIGGPMLDLHVHDAHFIRLVFGMPRAVTTQGRLRGELAEYWNSQFEYDDSDLVVSATSGTIDQQVRAFDHGFEIHLERATLLFEFAVIGGTGRYLCAPTLLDSRGRVEQPKLAGGDPLDAFAAEIGEVLRCLRKKVRSAVLNAKLAGDAIRLCHKQTESLRGGRKVRI
jgi:predicted dehydrogenase